MVILNVSIEFKGKDSVIVTNKITKSTQAIIDKDSSVVYLYDKNIYEPMSDQSNRKEASGV